LSADPADELLEVDVELETDYLEMPVSTQEFSEVFLQGWVVISQKPPGERIPVEITIASTGQYNIGATPLPNILYFDVQETQYFNLSIRFQEDAPPGFQYLVDVDARAESRIANDVDTFHLTVFTVPELDGHASMLQQPDPTEPGSSTTGLVQVTNSGTKYAMYDVSISKDPDSVVDTIDFNIEVEMTPNWVEKVPFDIQTAGSARPGDHTVTLALNVVNDDGTRTQVDTFEVTISIKEPEDERTLPYTIIMAVAVLISVFIIAFLVRRKA
jgi:hypothetical protein